MEDNLEDDMMLVDEAYEAVKDHIDNNCYTKAANRIREAVHNEDKKRSL